MYAFVCEKELSHKGKNNLVCEKNESMSLSFLISLLLFVLYCNHYIYDMVIRLPSTKSFEKCSVKNMAAIGRGLLYFGKHESKFGCSLPI